jgi:heme A synthase
VLKKLVALDASALRAATIALHLVNTNVLLAGLTGMLWNMKQEPKTIREPFSGRWGLLLGWCLVGALGALVALGDTLFPAESLQHGWIQEWASESHFVVRLRFLHPILAIAVSLWTLKATLGAEQGPAARFALAVRSLIGAQLLCGFANWFLLAPVPLQIFHLFLSACIWMTWIAFLLASPAPIDIPGSFAPERASTPSL